MYIFTIFYAGRKLGATPLAAQAMRHAYRLAAANGAPIIVEATRLADHQSRRVQINADGSIIKLWEVSA